MKKSSYWSAVIILIGVCIVGSFWGGYCYGKRSSIQKSEAEDYALMNVLANVGYARYLEKGDYANFRQLIDVNLSDALSRVEKYQGDVADEDFIDSKIRTLNAAAKLWEEHPPSTAGQWNNNNWKQTLENNMRLLNWAKEQCAKKQALKCKTAAH